MSTNLKRILALLMALITALSIAVFPTSAEDEETTAPETQEEVIPEEEAPRYIDATELTDSHLTSPFNFGYSYRYHNGYDAPSLTSFFRPFAAINKITQTLFGFRVFGSETLDFTAEGFVDDIFIEMAECSFFDGYELTNGFPLPNRSAQNIIDLFQIDVPKTAENLEVKIREHNANGEPVKAYALIFIQAYLKQITTIRVYERQINATTYQLMCDMTYKYGGTETYGLDFYYDAEKQVLYDSKDEGLFSLGFNYDVDDHFLYATTKSWQKQFGFRLLYDFVANIVIMDYNTERVKFTYGDREWMFQFWKGRYAIAPGGEVGIYNRAIGSKGSYYDCAVNDMMPMSIEVYHEDELILKNGPMEHWWITGFYIGQKYYRPESLRLKGTIEFPTEEMATVFTEEANTHKRLHVEQDGNTITYEFNSFINI